jgi:peptidyl-prolyl cis-trans isomerase SurA
LSIPTRTDRRSVSNPRRGPASSIVPMPSAAHPIPRRRPAALDLSLACLTLAASLLLVGPLATPAHTAEQAGEQVIEGIAAQVGNDIVLASEVLEFSAPIEERMRQAGAPPAEIAAMRRDALERLIETKLLSSVVERLELGADREEIDAAIAAIAEDNGLTIEQLLASVTSHGLTLDEYRGKIRDEIERSKVVNAMVRSRVQLEAEEVRALYDERFGDQRDGGTEVYVRHLLVMPDGRSASSAEQACSVVGAARAEISSGEADFPSVARRVSDLNPERGGDLGWIHRADLAAWMSDIVETMQPGQLSEVIRMPFGCNLLELVDRREFKPITFEQAEPQLRSYLFQQKTEVEYTKWLDVLREQTYIERKGAFGG